MNLKLPHSKFWIRVFLWTVLFVSCPLSGAFYIRDLSVGLGGNFQQSQNSLNHFGGFGFNGDFESTSVWFERWSVIVGVRWQKYGLTPNIITTLSDIDPTLALYTANYDYLSGYLGLTLFENEYYKITPLTSIGFPLGGAMLHQADYPESKTQLDAFFKQFWWALGLRASFFLWDLKLDPESKSANSPLKAWLDTELWYPLQFASNTQLMALVTLRIGYVF